LLVTKYFIYLYSIEGSGGNHEYIAQEFATVHGEASRILKIGDKMASNKTIFKLKDLPCFGVKGNEHLNHASREGDRPAPAIGL
jgi:hypothetical protein